MKNLILFFSFVFFAASFAHAQDEADIPPPPMPEYMKKYNKDKATKTPPVKPQVQENVTATPAESFDNQSTGSIKNEFLQAGEEDSEDSTLEPVEDIIEEPLVAEETSLEVIAKPTVTLEDIPTPEPPQEVSEIEIAIPEIEQSEMSEPVTADIKRNYQQGTASELQEEVAIMEDAEEKTLESARKPSSKKAFKAGMHKFAKECTMHAEPRSMSDEAGTIRSGRKLWIDAHNDSWHKAYKKSGTVYISAHCLQ